MLLHLGKLSGANLNICFAIIFLILLLPNPVLAHAVTDTTNLTPDRYDREKALAFSQSVLNRTLGHFQFTNQDKRTVDITDYRGKPLIISLVYTSCHHICPTLTTNLARVVEIAQEALGENSFSVVTIGFDTAVDSPERMRLFARERKIDMPQWNFLSTDQDTIEDFSGQTGFIFFKSAKGFDHLTQTTLLDADGRIYRQIYGIDFEPQQLIEPLKDLVFGKRSESSLVENLFNNIRLFCTIYDPHSGRYEFDYSIFISIGMGIVILGSMGTYLVRAWRKNDLKGSG